MIFIIIIINNHHHHLDRKIKSFPEQWNYQNYTIVLCLVMQDPHCINSLPVMAPSLVLLSGAVGRKQLWGSFRAVLGLSRAHGLVDNWLPSAGIDENWVITLHKVLLISVGLSGNVWDLAEINKFKITAVEEGVDGRETPQYRCFAFQGNLVDRAVHVNLWNKCGFGEEKKKFIVSKPYLLLDGGKKCRLNMWHRAQKTYLQEISLWGNLDLSGKTV